MKSPIRILVLSSGDGAGINFCNSLKLCGDKYHIIGAETNIFRLHYATADEAHLLPLPEDMAYWPALKQLVKKTCPDFVYASDTNEELAMLSEHRDELGVPHFLPPKEAVEVYEDKWRSYQYFKAAKIMVPETILVNEPRDVDLALNEFGNIWLRATHGSGGRGSLPTNNATLAKAWIDRHDGWGHFTAAEVLTKRMATWIGLWKDGAMAVCQGRNRLHWEYGDLAPSGVTGITGAQSTTSDPIVHATALAAIASVPHKPHGIVCVDLTYDRNGVPCPTEIQASRFYSSIYFLAKAGLNLPDMFVEMGLTGKMPEVTKKEHPLADDLVWLKAVDCAPQLTTLEMIKRRQAQCLVVPNAG